MPALYPNAHDNLPIPGGTGNLPVPSGYQPDGIPTIH